MTYAIQTSNLSKTFDGVHAVDGLNIQVPKGTIYGFIGPNGAGKTTTLKMLTGMIKPDAGQILIEGKPISFGKNDFTNIGFLPDVPEYYNWMRAKEFLSLCGALFQIPKIELDKRIKHLLDLSGIDTNKRIKGYSRGMKQRLGMAQALINNPSIVFLDEPTSALDPIGRKEMLDMIYNLKGQTTVFFSTHILVDVERVCDRIAIMDHGKMIMEDGIEAIKQKHILNRLFLRTDQNQLMHDLLVTLPWVNHVAIEENNLIIEVNHLELARKQISSVLSKEQISLLEFKAIEPTLEDIFVKAVHV